MRWLDRFSLLTLTIIAIPLALAPFLPAPHLWEKIQMLFAGELRQVIDWLDLFMHGTPFLILMIKLIRTIRDKNRTPVTPTKLGGE